MVSKRKPTVGILSMQRVINYGSFLQAYALRELLKHNGAGDIYFVDIIPGKILIEDAPIKQNKFIRHLRKLISLIKEHRLISGMKTLVYDRKLKHSIKKNWNILQLDYKPQGPLDLLVIGSDEVFNCCQGTYWGYSTQLFGAIPSNVASKVISYAGSFGYTELSDLKKYGIDKEIGNLIRKLDDVSVRDENSRSIIETLTSVSPPIHLDPVLAYGFSKEISDMTHSHEAEKYLIVYSYQERIRRPDEIKAIVGYARKEHLKIVSIFCRYDWCDKYVIPETPIEVLRWFKFAECIVTDTFHGTIFSVITHSKFATLVRPSNINKLHFLLNMLGCENREVQNTSNLAMLLQTEPDFQKCDKTLTQLRNEANSYIRLNIEALKEPTSGYAKDTN